MNRKTNYLLIGLFALLFVWSCSKTIEDPTPDPFSNQDNNNNQQPDTLDPSSIAGLHKKIFQPKCAMPACHDGSFEPDYRTIQSTYNTLVWHPVIKNNSQLSFSYRAVPYDTAKSWLMERITTDDAVLGRMPLYSKPLDKTETDLIAKWIMDGCRDVNGKPAQYPNLYPQIITRAAFDQNGKRIDTVWSGQRFLSPFVVAPGSTVTLLIQVKDDSTAVNQLKESKVKFSYVKDDFSTATVKTATYLTQEFYQVQFNTAEFQAGKQVFFQFSTKDAHHNDPAEFPVPASPFYYKELFSFIIQ